MGDIVQLDREGKHGYKPREIYLSKKDDIPKVYDFIILMMQVWKEVVW